MMISYSGDCPETCFVWVSQPEVTPSGSLWYRDWNAVQLDKHPLGAKSGRRLYGNNKKRVHFAVFIANGHILSWPKNMGTKPVPGLFILIRIVLVVEHPARMLRTARFVDKETVLLFAVPESENAAVFAMLLPLRRVDVPCCVERCHEFVTMPRGP
jgi:hypothetical protein